MRAQKLGVAAILLMAFVSCSRERANITGGYGNSVLSGQVVMQNTAIETPAGVEVSVLGTGMTTVLSADGQFAFSGVPDGAELHFRRAADGVDATMRMESGAAHVVVALAQTTATHSSKRRGVGRGGEQVYEFEGVIRSVATDSLVVFTSHKEEVTIGLTPETIIRKGDQVVTAADLVVDGRVHVKAKKLADAYSAILVIVQTKDDGDDDGLPAVQKEYEGVVRSASATELVIFDSHRNDVTFVVDASTDIRKGNTPVAPADIQVGWRVHVKATVAGDTKTAVRVIIQDDRVDDSPKTREYEGVVVSASGTELVVDVASGPDVTFVLNPETVIRKHGTAVTPADLAAGQRVEVRASVASDGTKTALRVTIETE